MKAAVPLLSDTIESRLAPRFARSPYHALIDTSTSEYEIIENAYRQMNSGAGRSIVEFLVTVKNVNAIIAFELGLNVQQKAHQKKVQLIIVNDKNTTLRKLLKLVKIKHVAL